MTEHFLILLVLGVVGGSVLLMACVIMGAARELRRTLRRIYAMLPGCESTVQEARETLTEARQLLARTNEATRHVESVIHKTCDAAGGFVDQVARWRDLAHTWWGARSGNGTKTRVHREHSS